MSIFGQDKNLDHRQIIHPKRMDFFREKKEENFTLKM